MKRFFNKVLLIAATIIALNLNGHFGCNAFVIQPSTKNPNNGAGNELIENATENHIMDLVHGHSSNVSISNKEHVIWKTSNALEKDSDARAPKVLTYSDIFKLLANWELERNPNLYTL